MSEFIILLTSISDKAINKSDENEIKKIIQNYNEKIEALTASEDKSYGYYILGNLWSELRKIEHIKNINNIWSLEQEKVFKEIYFFRKAIQLAKLVREAIIYLSFAIHIEEKKNTIDKSAIINLNLYEDK